MIDQEEKLAIFYCQTMEELKARVTTMSEIVWAIRPPATELENRHSHFMLEGLYLQLRKVIELLSRAMLAVQSADSGFSSSNLDKAYRADQIIKAVEAINPSCFPRPVAPGKWAADDIECVLEHLPVFTSKELKDAYFECDKLLHIWTLKDVGLKRIKELNQDFLKSWISRLLDGLNHHIVSLPVENRHMLVAMHDTERGTVKCTFASRHV